MARKRHDALTYATCRALFNGRRKGAEHRTIFRDCLLYNRGDYFEVHHKQFQTWEHQGSKGYKAVYTTHPMATIDKNDVLTMTWAGRIDITTCNRLTKLTGYPVGPNKKDYGNCKQHVRVYCVDLGYKHSLPYFTGMQWDVKSGGAVPLNPQPDVKIITDNDKVQAAKKKFSDLRKLCKVSVKMGAFDEFSGQYMDNRWQIHSLEAKPMDKLDAANPDFESAMSVLIHGARNTIRPDMHYYDHINKRYIPRDVPTVRREWLNRSVENGLKQLRKTFYEANDGYIEVTA